VPSVLVETGYLSNRYEAKILSKPYYQQHIARTVASAVVAMNKGYGK
jgi:N-acetylmuramoyl-L-alanine amidase